jgi:excisionase family DNA binding protein
VRSVQELNSFKKLRMVSGGEPMEALKNMLTPADVAAVLGIPPRRVSELIAAGLPVVVLGRRTRRIPADAFVAWLARRAATTELQATHLP